MATETEKQHIEKIRFLEKQLREANKLADWWSDKLLAGELIFTG